MSTIQTSAGAMRVARISTRGTIRLVLFRGHAIAQISTPGAHGSVLVSPEFLPPFRARSITAGCRQLAALQGVAL